jgi:hypothetical protein
MGTSFVSSSECCCATIHSLFFLQNLSSVGQTQQTMVTMGLLVYVPKIVLLVFMLGEDIFRVGAGSIIILMIMKEQTS